MRKDITIDFKTYEQEIEAAKLGGREDGIAVARRVMLELLAGATIDSLDIDGDANLHYLVEDLFPRIHRMKGRDGGTK